MSKLTPKAAVHKHEKGMHKGEPLTKMKCGGSAKKYAAGGKAELPGPKMAKKSNKK